MVRILSLSVQLLFLCASFSIVISSSPLIWNEDTSYPLSYEYSVALTGQDDCIYVFGGMSGRPSSSVSFSPSYKFNITAGSPKVWTPIASMPITVKEANGFVANDGRFFIFGEDNEFQIYNATDNTWNTTSPNLPNGTTIDDIWMSCAVDSSTGLMYITGGYIDGTRFYSYNVSSNNITNLSSSSPSPFNLWAQGSFVANNNKLYVFGGCQNESYAYSASTYIYNIASRNWSIGANMTFSSCQFGYATDGNLFYEIGGESSVGYLHTTQVYNISANIWSVNNGTVIKNGLYANTAVFVDGSLHTICGYHNGYSSLHQISSLCGVYTFSGSCNDENQCILHGTCQINGQCNGTCMSFSGCNCESSSTTTTTTTTTTSTTSITSSTTSISTTLPFITSGSFISVSVSASLSVRIVFSILALFLYAKNLQ